jgi:hypothetical protein
MLFHSDAGITGVLYPEWVSWISIICTIYVGIYDDERIDCAPVAVTTATVLIVVQYDNTACLGTRP